MRCGNAILACSRARLRESLIFSRLIASHAIPRTKLAAPIFLDSDAVGGDAAWQILLGCATASAGAAATRYIVDKNFTFNGFDLSFAGGEAGQVLQIVGAAGDDVTPGGLGLAHLRELIKLVMIARNGDVVVRPAAVVEYFRGRAREMAAAPDDDPPSLLERFVEEVLKEGAGVFEGGDERFVERVMMARCPHGNAIFQRIWTVAPNE